MKHIRGINESMSYKELAEELKSGATWIEPAYLGKEKRWGVIYWKDKVKHEEGGFNSDRQVCEFLVDNDIDFKGKEGYELMRRFREKEIAKIPYPSYQRELLDNGLEEYDDEIPNEEDLDDLDDF